MTPDDLNDRLDAMIAAAGDDPNKLPGLITVQTDDWIKSVSGVKATCKALNDGLRHRDVVVQISSDNRTEVLARSEASGRGQPYRDPMPRPE